MVTAILETKASAKEIWEALTWKENMKKWYFDIPDFTTEIGGKFDFYESEAKEFLHRCEVLQCITEEVFQHTWTHPNESKGSSVVTWKIEDRNENRIVTLTHSGLESFVDAGDNFKPSNYQMGWDAIVKSSLRNFLVGTERLVFPIEIEATPEKVWNALWKDENYRFWTTPFCEGSFFKGELKQGSRIHFLAPDGSGMYSDTEFYTENKTAVFKHIGELKNFQEQLVDETAKEWTGCFEIYKLNELPGGITKLTCEMDCTKDHIAFMKNAFPLGLEKVKELSERN